MRMFSKSLVALGLAAVLTTPAMAQQRGRGGFGRAGLSMLLSNASVQEELKLDDSQKDKAREFAEKAREKMTAARDELQGLDQEERMKKFREMAAESNAAARKFAATSLSTIVEFVANGQGVTLLPEIALRKEATDPRIAIHPIASPGAGRVLSLVWREATPFAAIFEHMAEVIRQVRSPGNSAGNAIR